MSGEGGAIAEVLAAAIDAEWMRPEHGCNGDPDACYGGSCPVPAYGRMGLDELRDSAVTGLLASPALADLLAAERQRGREEVRTRVEGTTGWVPDPDAGEPYIYASDLRRALADVPAAAEGDE